MANYWGDFNYDAYGGAGFGDADLNHVRGLGYSGAQIRGLAHRAQQQGRNIPSTVQAWINSNSQAGPWNYSGHGGLQYGMADINAGIAQGASYNQMKEYSDWANTNQLGTGAAAQDWFAQNKDNYNYMDAAQKRDIMLQDNLAAEARAQETWTKQQAEHKANNPRIHASNRQMQAGSAGGVAIKRSEDFRREGGTRSTAQAGRGMFIESLNI